MEDYFSCSDAIRRIEGKHFTDEVVSFSKKGDILSGVICPINFSIQLFIRVAFVWKVSNEHDEHHDPKSPDISCFSSVL